MRAYDEALRYLFSLERFGTVFGLENIRWILGLLDNPERSFPVIHVAGTNGKGSVSAMISAIIRESGYSVGMYTSPHLISFRERMAVNGEAASEEDVAAMTDRVRTAVETADKGHFFTYFDFATAMAFQHFKEAKVDVAVAEVGMGGRLDSTNVVHPVATVIVNVSTDHTDYLGSGIAAIAAEKAGIVKHGVPVVTAARGEALDVIEARAETLQSPLYALDREFRFEKTATRKMSYDGPRFHIPELFVSLAGDHQLANAAVALCAVEVLPEAVLSIPPKSAFLGLAKVTWPGRLEMAATRPPILFDGAHNAEGVRSLRQYLETYEGARRTILVFGSMKDKDYAAMIREIAPQVDRFIFTAPDMDRAATPELLASFADGASVAPTVPEALRLAKSMASADDLIVIAGSLFLVGEAKRYIDEIF